jgi:hypothetical protein
MTYNVRAAARKPAEITVPSTLDWREFWRVNGSWRSLFDLHVAIVNRLQAASSSWVSS